MLCSVLSLPRHRLPICNFQENKSQCKENRQACNRHVDRSACQFYSCNNCRTEERWLLCLPTSYPFLLKVHLQEVYRTLHDGQPAYSVSANDPYIPAVPGFRFLFSDIVNFFVFYNFLVCQSFVLLFFRLQSFDCIHSRLQPNRCIFTVPAISFRIFFTTITIVAHLYFNCYPVPIRSISNDC